MNADDPLTQGVPPVDDGGVGAGIWRFAGRLPPIDESARVTLGEGSTPLEESPALARWAGLRRLWLKREDRNPTGSHKDRGAAYQISRCRATGDRVAVISSSGNAAVAASTYGSAAGVTVVGLGS